MNLAERLNEKSVVIENIDNTIVKEIVDYFKEWFESGQAEKYIEKIIDKDNLSKRELEMNVEFWKYTSGCSDTNFRIGGKSWTNGLHCWESDTYKGVRLISLQKIIGPKLLNLAEYHFKNMGFNVRVESAETWLGYYKKKIILTW